MFSITTDPHRKLVRVTITGMLTTDDVRELYRQERQAVLGMACRLGDHLALADLTGCALQLQDVAAAFQREMHSIARARRLALVVGGSVVKMQVRRILRRADAALFATVDGAEQWLFAAGDKAAA